MTIMLTPSFVPGPISMHDERDNDVETQWKHQLSDIVELSVAFSRQNESPVSSAHFDHSDDISNTVYSHQCSQRASSVACRIRGGGTELDRAPRASVFTSATQKDYNWLRGSLLQASELLRTGFFNQS